jgi:coenzyme F420-0:L-glutamate ligase / coenzyme F420-1:gamma-L-glutamate ligase
MTSIPSFSAYAIPDIPLIQEGDNVLKMTLDKISQANFDLQNGDVLVVSSKIISKAQGQRIRLDSVIPSEEALSLAEETAKDPRIVELILKESLSVSRKRKGVLVTQHRLGFVSANSGIDQSNVKDGEESALLLPIDPDKTAQEFRTAIMEQLGVDVGIVISDTHGRPFRIGNVGVAIGVAGAPAVKDLRGRKDLYGRELESSLEAYADLVASAAHLLCGEADEGYPVILMRGVDISPPYGIASDMNRLPENDLYL